MLTVVTYILWFRFIVDNLLMRPWNLRVCDKTLRTPPSRGLRRLVTAPTRRSFTGACSCTSSSTDHSSSPSCGRWASTYSRASASAVPAAGIRPNNATRVHLHAQAQRLLRQALAARGAVGGGRTCRVARLQHSAAGGASWRCASGSRAPRAMLSLPLVRGVLVVPRDGVLPGRPRRNGEQRGLHLLRLRCQSRVWRPGDGRKTTLAPHGQPPAVHVERPTQNEIPDFIVNHHQLSDQAPAATQIKQVPD